MADLPELPTPITPDPDPRVKEADLTLVPGKLENEKGKPRASSEAAREFRDKI